MLGLEIHAATPDRWLDMVELFERPGPRGAWPRAGACYCMFWRLEPPEYEANFRQRSLDNETGGPNKRLMAEIVGRGDAPGLLAYRHGHPIGWVAVSPRSELVRLRSVPGSLVDDRSTDDGTWSISCFYIHRSEWRSGVGKALLAAAVAWAGDRGAAVVEAYPVQVGNIDPYTGYDVMFERSGFELVRSGRGKGRSLWRRALQPESG